MPFFRIHLSNGDKPVVQDERKAETFAQNVFSNGFSRVTQVSITRGQVSARTTSLLIFKDHIVKITEIEDDVQNAE